MAGAQKYFDALFTSAKRLRKKQARARITFGERLQRFGGMQPRRHASSPGCLRAPQRAASVGPAAPSLSRIGFIGGAKFKSKQRAGTLASFSVSRLSSHCFDNGPVRS